MSAKPSAPTAMHWADIGESTAVAGIWFLYGVHRFLGRWPLRICLYPVVAYYWASRPLARQASLQYLRRMQAAHGVFGGVPGSRHSLRHFMSFAETILEKILAASGRYRFQQLRFEGRERMDAMLAQGLGGILLTAHIGCLELCQALADRAPGLKLNILVHTRHAERFNRVLQRLNPASPVQLLQVTEVDAATAVMLGEKVARGEFVAIAADRVPVRHSKTASAVFLGHEARFPVGGFVLASLFKCPLLMIGCLRQGAGHAVVFECLAEQVALPRRGRAERLDELAAQFAQSMEKLLLRSPYDWFNFYPFWDQPGAAASGTTAVPHLPEVTTP
ncbi:MAG: acyltransferase [Rhodoferax sp.]|nr:acyltransferase [Rhodoferax sp.]